MNQTVKIFKDVATVLDLTPEDTPVNQDKFHYSVTEGQLSATISTEGRCNAVGFTPDLFYDKVIDDSEVFYLICVNYVCDCEGTIYPGEVKTCTIENYIVEGHIDPLQTSGNTAGSVQSSSQKFNIQVIQSQPNILADIMPSLAE